MASACASSVPAAITGLTNSITGWKRRDSPGPHQNKVEPVCGRERSGSPAGEIPKRCLRGISQTIILGEVARPERLELPALWFEAAGPVPLGDRPKGLPWLIIVFFARFSRIIAGLGSPPWFAGRRYWFIRG